MSSAGFGQSATLRTSESLSETESDESGAAFVVRAAAVLARAHVFGAQTRDLRLFRRAVAAAELLADVGVEDYESLAGALLANAVRVPSVSINALREHFGTGVLLIAAQAVPSASLAPGSALRALTDATGVMTRRAAIVALALLVAELDGLYREPPASFTFERFRYHCLWLRYMHAELGCEHAELSARMRARLTDLVMWRGAPRYLRLGALARAHGDKLRALNYYFDTLDRSGSFCDSESSETTTASAYSTAESVGETESERVAVLRSSKLAVGSGQL